MSFTSNFQERAKECLRFAAHARTRHDRELFIDMAKAWYGEASMDPADIAMDAIIVRDAGHGRRRTGRHAMHARAR